VPGVPMEAPAALSAPTVLRLWMLLLAPAHGGSAKNNKPKCFTSAGHEHVANKLLGRLFDEQVVSPTGSVVDAGSHQGQWAFVFAANHTRARVHAVDPSRKSINHLKSLARRCRIRNLHTMRGGLGAEHATLDFLDFAGSDGVGMQISIASTPPQSRGGVGAKQRASEGPKRDPFTIYTLDELFHDEPLAFAHLDVEGHELAVLRGGNATLSRDRPHLTTEVHVQRDHALAASVLAYAESLGYVSYLIEEACGARRDCRNLLHVPRETMRAFVASPAVVAARADGTLRLVDSFNLHAHGSPCCVPHGPCCPDPADAAFCCSRAAVAAYGRRRARGAWLSRLSVVVG